MSRIVYLQYIGLPTNWQALATSALMSGVGIAVISVYFAMLEDHENAPSVATLVFMGAPVVGGLSGLLIGVGHWPTVCIYKILTEEWIKNCSLGGAIGGVAAGTAFLLREIPRQAQIDHHQSIFPILACVGLAIAQSILLLSC